LENFFSFFSRVGRLDEVSDVHGHLLNLGVVEPFDVAEHHDVLLDDEVDGNSLPAEATTAADSKKKEEKKED